MQERLKNVSRCQRFLLPVKLVAVLLKRSEVCCRSDNAASHARHQHRVAVTRHTCSCTHAKSCLLSTLLWWQPHPLPGCGILLWHFAGSAQLVIVQRLLLQTWFRELLQLLTGIVG